MDLVSVHPIFNLYNRRWPIRGAAENLAPAKFVHGGLAQESVVGAGSIISAATVRNSVLSSNVIIDDGATVEGSVLMPGVRIGRGAVVRKAILDKNVVVGPGEIVGVEQEKDRSKYTVSAGGVVAVGKASASAPDPPPTVCWAAGTVCWAAGTVCWAEGRLDMRAEARIKRLTPPECPTDGSGCPTAGSNRPTNGSAAQQTAPAAHQVEGGDRSRRRGRRGSAGGVDQRGHLGGACRLGEVVDGPPAQVDGLVAADDSGWGAVGGRWRDPEEPDVEVAGRQTERTGDRVCVQRYGLRVQSDAVDARLLDGFTTAAA